MDPLERTFGKEEAEVIRRERNSHLNRNFFSGDIVQFRQVLPNGTLFITQGEILRYVGKSRFGGDDYAMEIMVGHKKRRVLFRDDGEDNSYIIL